MADEVAFWSNLYFNINTISVHFTSATIPLHFIVLIVLGKNFYKHGKLYTEYYQMVFALELVDALNAILNLVNDIVRRYPSLYEEMSWWLKLHMVSRFN